MQSLCLTLSETQVEFDLNHRAVRIIKSETRGKWKDYDEVMTNTKSKGLGLGLGLGLGEGRVRA